MNDVLKKLQTLGAQVQVLAALNRIPMMIAAGIFALALLVWGVWAINHGKERVIDSRITAAIELSQRETLDKVKAELDAQDLEMQKSITELLNNNNTSLVRLEGLQKKLLDQNTRLEAMLKADTEGTRRVSASTREMLKQSRENFQ